MSDSAPNIFYMKLIVTYIKKNQYNYFNINNYLYVKNKILSKDFSIIRTRQLKKNKSLS